MGEDVFAQPLHDMGDRRAVRRRRGRGLVSVVGVDWFHDLDTRFMTGILALYA